jgi:H+-transporting ATPase
MPLVVVCSFSLSLSLSLSLTLSPLTHSPSTHLCLAADIVLLSPGLGVIINAIIASRKIFQRMRNYAMYSIASTVRIVLFFGILTIAFDWMFPTLLIAIMAILNDGTCIAISKDTVEPSKTPDSWNLTSIFTVSTFLGLHMFAASMLLWLLMKYTHVFQVFALPVLTDAELRGLIYLQCSVTGQLTIFSTRVVDGFWWQSRPSKTLLLAFVFAQTLATIFGLFGFNNYPNDGETDFDGCGWDYALVAWLWAIAWFTCMDPIKLTAYYGMHYLQVGNRDFKSKGSSHAHPVYGAGTTTSGGVWPKLQSDINPEDVLKKADQVPRASFDNLERPRRSMEELSRKSVDSRKSGDKRR